MNEANQAKLGEALQGCTLPPAVHRTADFVSGEMLLVWKLEFGTNASERSFGAKLRTRSMQPSHFMRHVRAAESLTEGAV